MTVFAGKSKTQVWFLRTTTVGHQGSCCIRKKIPETAVGTADKLRSIAGNIIPKKDF